MDNLKYLRLLAKEYPGVEATATEIINLTAICNLPKGTEHFVSDIHGEYEPFLHMLRSASGEIKRKIEDIFSSSLTPGEMRSLATLIYYPERKIELIKKDVQDLDTWYRVTLRRLIEVCKAVSSKYTRSKVRKSLKPDFAYVIDELLHADGGANKENYYNAIISSMIELDRADAFIIAISSVIQRLAIDRLHVLGDIYDRGPRPDIIMDALLQHHSVDIQWGNHDIVWMGAAAGSEICVANALRVSIRYNNFDMLEDGYGITLRELSDFAAETYKDDPCEFFMPSVYDENVLDPVDQKLAAKMHKAISIIEFKLEGQLAKRREYLGLSHRRCLEAVDYKNGTMEIAGQIYELRDSNFPTVNPDDPFALTEAEENLINHLTLSFRHSKQLRRHIDFLFSKGSLYLTYNGNLLFHGCVPMTADGSLKAVKLFGREMSGREYFDFCDYMVRRAYHLKKHDEGKQEALDFVWYLWCGADSPLFGKDKMTTFERYFVADKSTHTENKNPYYKLLDKIETAEMILKEFSLDTENGHVINGHVPVKIKNDESPVKAGGKLLVIDGGMAKSYQKTTGIAGYTLIFNSHTLTLVSHEPFTSIQSAINDEYDLQSTRKAVGELTKRIFVGDTDTGKMLKERIDALTDLLKAYENGEIRENF